MRFSDKLEALLARAELVASGAEPLRQRAQEELERGRPWRARELSLRILDELPNSPLALAIWADAAEAMLLDDEASQALAQLSALLPYRADVWTRLAALQQRLGADVTALLERALTAGEPADAAAEALCRLLEQALDAGQVARALALTARLHGSRVLTPTLRFRLAEAALASGARAQAGQLVAGDVRPELLDARGWLTQARLWLDADEARAPFAFKRALLLGSAAVQQAVRELLMRPPRRQLMSELWPLVEQLGLARQGEWQVARALTETEPARALQSIEQHARAANTPAACAAWLDAALWARDRVALERALEAAHALGMGEQEQASVAAALALARALGLSGHQRLAALDSIGGAAAAWADELRTEVYAHWLGQGTDQGWHFAFDEAEKLARDSLDLVALTALASLRLDLGRPLRVTVIGEFNAGKSSLINALVGEAVLPVGVLPTTATVNRLCWAPERSVRVEFADRTRPASVLEYSAARDYLTRIDPASVNSVSMFAPLDALRELELIDTPGFNADVQGHDQVALDEARRAHVLLWVLDATAPLKHTDAGQLLGSRDLPLPTCIVLNKADRLHERELSEVMEHVREGLVRLELVPLIGPLAVSAIRAEQARSDLTGLVETLRARSVELKANVVAQRMHALLSDLEARLFEQESKREGARLAALTAAATRAEAARVARQVAALAHTETLEVVQDALATLQVGESCEHSSDSEAQRLRRLAALITASARAARASRAA